ncbi:DUF2189 domain-containing protein [Colwellia ponticola]|uniref:DUF2189 domain-containing protein n=1 Tax=Colwellia ponticola TaxID=2304625 RepID=A0A8H2PL27_9GAMM|nr:DUF2189 domain-containing protein [Colwellia ponticola]TMM43724.1 DUF2189 domain-containing protein [Colwellia ponticola]
MATSHIEYSKEKTNTVKTRDFSRAIDANVVSAFAPFHWLSLAVKDFFNAPLIALSYGLLFSIVPISICFLVLSTQNHLFILPATVAFAVIGPAFATGLYDVAWELEKGHTPTFTHSLKSMFRNPVGEWGFALVLVIIMMAWMRIAALIHVLYPSQVDPSLEQLISFLAMGVTAGAIISVVVFTLSAFTPQIMVERRVDIMTALTTSVKAVNKNAMTMFIWSLIILTMVGVSVLTLGIGFIITMPILAFASWHAYIAVIKTKRQRDYE